ncbi:hypothetical protein C5S29_01285 [ANME-1 cluster archaeon GoMg3.2]|nr:hypothetical protein [ANME-1 cluster archaeon GoMg3.2]
MSVTNLVNVKLVEKLLWLIERLKETRGLRIFKFKLAGDGAVNNRITKILSGEKIYNNNLI